ncbi:MAG: hypothetical protein AAF702_01310 [Chloroflexota bacterium]
MIRQSHQSGLIFLLYIGVTVLMTMPLITHLGSHIPTAEGSDQWVHEWTFWWIEQALLSGQNPFYTNLLFHPNGTSLTTHNIAWFNIGLWFPLQALLDNTAAYSLTFLLVFTLNAFCMYLFAFSWLKSRAAAIPAGLIYGFWPYVFTQGDHPNMSTIMWLPLALYYLKRNYERRSIRDLLLAALCIALIGIARWQLLLVASISLGIFLLYLLSQSIFQRHSFSQQKEHTFQPTKSKNTSKDQPSLFMPQVIRLALPFLLAGGLMLPLGGPVIYAQLTENFPEEVLVHEPWFSSSLFSYVLPNSHLAFYQSIVSQLPSALQFHTQRVDFLGYSVLLLALIAFWGYWRQAGIWFVMALVYWLLALGPELQLGNGISTDFPMPYRLVEELTVVQLVRQPNRFNAFVGLPLGLMAGYGLLTLRRMIGYQKGFLLCTTLFCLLILGEYWAYPYALESTRIPQWYHQLAKEPDDFAIFGLPPSTRLADKYFMHYQILHQKPMIEGHISRPSYATFGFMDQSDYLWHLRIHREMKPELMAVTHQLRLLADADVRYLILHKNFLTPAQLAQFVDWLTYDPFYEDDEVMVYHTSPQMGKNFAIEEWMSAEVGLIRTHYMPETIPQGEPLSVDARWGSRGHPSIDYDACLVLYNDPPSNSPNDFQNPSPSEQAREAGHVAQRTCHPIGGELTTSFWQVDEVARGDYTMRIDPLLEPGMYTLALEVKPTGQSANEPERAKYSERVLGPVTITERERTFAVPAPEHVVNVTFGQELQLYGFDVAREANRVQIALYWQALQRMARSYKVFVHLIDSDTGMLIAQNDSVPRQWTYPTTWWEANEFVDDRLELTIEQATEANIRLLVGLYDEETITRLPARDAEGNHFPDDAAVLIDLE